MSTSTSAHAPHHAHAPGSTFPCPVPAQSVRSAAATLPLTVDAQHRERIVLVDGDSGWVERTHTALASRSDTIALVSSPFPEDASALAPLAARIVLNTTWGYAPVLDTAAAQLRTHTSPLVEALCETRRSSHRCLCEVLDVLDRLVGVAELRLVLVDEDRLVASGASTDGRRLRVTAARTGRHTEGLRVRSIGPDSAVDLHLTDDGTAHPARLLITGPAESNEPHTPWEVPSRSAWRRAVDLVDSSGIGEDAMTDVGRMLRIVSLLEDTSLSAYA